MALTSIHFGTLQGNQVTEVITMVFVFVYTKLKIKKIYLVSMWWYTGKGQRTTVGVVCFHVDPRDQM